RRPAPGSGESGGGFTPAERAGGRGGAPLAPRSSKRTGARFTRPGAAKRTRAMSGGEFTSPPRKRRAGGLGGAPLAPLSSTKLEFVRLKRFRAFQYGSAARPPRQGGGHRSPPRMERRQPRGVRPRDAARVRRAAPDGGPLPRR